MHVKCEYGPNCLPGKESKGIQSRTARAKKFIILPSKSSWWSTGTKPGRSDDCSPYYLPVCGAHLKSLSPSLKDLPQIKLNEGYRQWVVQSVMSS